MTSTLPNYNAFQQVFALSGAANLLRTCTEEESILQDRLRNALVGTGDLFNKHVGPGWELVWGPAVWRYKPGSNTFPDHVWFVAKNQSFAVDGQTPGCAYVVAIAATTGSTNWQSLMHLSYDWTKEDFAVQEVVDLNAWIKQNNNNGLISQYPITTKVTDESQTLLSHGTAQGVYVLASQPPASSSPTNRIGDFLKSLEPDGAKLIFTGHSLGGALSPALAFALTKAGYLDKFKGNTLVYPTAGASPGNGTFANQFSQMFPPCRTGDQFYQVWNTNIVNTLDIVPHAWCTDTSNPFNLYALPTIYHNNRDGPVGLVIGIAVDRMAKAASKAGSNIYQPLQNSQFSGEMPPSPPWRYLDVAGKQHTNAYAHHILGTEFHDSLCGKSKSDPLYFSGSPDDAEGVELPKGEKAETSVGN